MSIRFLTALLLTGFVIAPASAKTVKTDTILVQPNDATAEPTIPAEEVLQDITPAAVEDEPEETLLPQVEESNVTPPEVFYDLSLLPPPVARMHDQLQDAAQNADFNRLKMVLESNEMPPTLSLTEIGDPIQFLKESSGDTDGLEILAILADTLSAGYVHVDEGTAQEMYIWPYFARYPFSKLTPVQKVEMYRMITSADFAEMEPYGIWLFYRVGIGKDGTLHYFVAGE